MYFYNWDGNILQLKKQPLGPIITHEEMNSSILEVIGKLKEEREYQNLFRNAFGDERMTPGRIYRSLAPYEYTLIAANSKYDKVTRNEGERFTESEARGYRIFQQQWESCHSKSLFTNQSFRKLGFPLKPSKKKTAGAGE